MNMQQVHARRAPVTAAEEFLIQHKLNATGQKKK